MLLTAFQDLIDSLAWSDDKAEQARARKRATIIVACLAVALVPFLWKPWVHGTDGARNYAYVRSALIDGDLDFTNEFAHYRATGDYQIAESVDPISGRPGNALGVGSSVLWSPFFLVGHLVAKVTSAEADGYSAPYVWCISFASTFYAILGLIVMTRVVAWRFGGIETLVGVVPVWLGSPLVFYMYLHPSMSHACSFFLCATMVWQYERWRSGQRLRHFFIMGAVCGLAIATRFNNGVFVLLVGSFWLRAVLLGPPSKKGLSDPVWLIAAGGLAAIGLLTGFAPQLIAWKSVYGEWFSGPRGYALGENLSLLRSSHFMHVLLSSWHGMLVWSPVLIFSLAGGGLLLRRWRLLDTTLGAMFLIQLWVIGGWHMWWGGASFGQRFFINCTPLFALGLAWLFVCLESGGPRRWLIALLAASMLWTAGLAVQYVSHMIRRERYVSLQELTYNQIYKVPATARDHLRFLWPGHRNDPSVAP